MRVLGVSIGYFPLIADFIVHDLSSWSDLVQALSDFRTNKQPELLCSIWGISHEVLPSLDVFPKFLPNTRSGISQNVTDLCRLLS